MKRLALLSAFSDKARSEKLMVVDDLSMGEIKTKAVAVILDKLGLAGRNVLFSMRGKMTILICLSEICTKWTILGRLLQMLMILSMPMSC